jgi:hypothetical protein
MVEKTHPVAEKLSVRGEHIYDDAVFGAFLAEENFAVILVDAAFDLFIAFRAERVHFSI